MPVEFWIAVAGQLSAILAGAGMIVQRIARVEQDVQWIKQTLREIRER